MTDIKIDNNNEILINAVKSLQLRFPVAEIERATGYKKSAISGYLNNKVPVSDAFLQTFSEAFKIDLREFGYTKGMERVETKNPQPSGEGFYKELVNHYKFLVERLERDLDFERSKNNKT